MSRARLLELFGLHASATPDEIKSRYHELARKFHPDVNAGDERAHARFRAIVAAYQELLEADVDAPARLDGDAGTGPTVEAGSPSLVDRDIENPKDDQPGCSGDGIARRRTELRTRLDQCTRALHRAQADVRDGDAKALAARGRGNDQMARHFERRVEADRSRVYALLGEISGLELELRGLEATRSGGDVRVTRVSTESELDPVKRLKREVESAYDEELAALKRRYDDRDKH